jgi:nitric oxide reductase activation protein
MPSTETTEERYHGFSLKSVCWGYRDLFRQSIENLLDDGLIGDDRREVTESFFGLLKQADQSCYDHVLKRFLGAINPGTEWLFDLPGIFTDVVETGHMLAAEKPHYGVTFFEVLGQGGFGQTPEHVRHLLGMTRRLWDIDHDLALALVRGYSKLLDRLSLREIELYTEAGIQAFARNHKSGIAFLEGTVESAETYILSLTREARLQDMVPLLGCLLKSLTGTEVAVESLAQLDSDDLIERGSNCVCMYRWLYLPERVRRHENREHNRSWYKLAAIVAAGALAEDSFSRIHGHPEFATLADLAGPDIVAQNLLLIGEWYRVLDRIRTRWPGARHLIDFGLRTDLGDRPPRAAADHLFALMATGAADPLATRLRDLVRPCPNVFATAKRLSLQVCDEFRAAQPGLAHLLASPLSFLPDYLFPGHVSAPPRDGLIADLKQAAEADAEGQSQDSEEKSSVQTPGDGEPDEEEEAQEGAIPACFVYDEWSNEEDDYLRDYCFVHESVPPVAPNAQLPADAVEEGRRLSRVFERFRPELTRKEKYLEDGEAIDSDRLLAYLVQRRQEPSPRIDFYEKPRINQRDLAVLILLDASGSTGESADEHEKIIDVEKRAALVLGQGLHTLGDQFAICGFSSNGRENCIYAVYKDFQESWEDETMSRLMNANPANSTRIGPALRHSGFRLGRIPAKQRLVILVTDGRPMDTGYDPNTRYAQHDVRVACEENERDGIHTFAITTEENSVADMEIMFPGHRFAILPDIRVLPKILPRLYTRLTL